MNESWHAEIYTRIQNEEIPLVGMTVVQGLPAQWQHWHRDISAPYTPRGNFPFWSLLPYIHNYTPTAAGVSN